MAKTEQGKAIAARNATKHGIYSNKPPTTDDQDLALYEKMKAGLTAEFEPQTISEDIEIERIAMARVRLQRLWRAEAATIEQQRLKARKQAIEPRDTLSVMLDELNEKEPVDPEIEAELSEIDRLLNELKSEKSSIIYDDKAQLRLQREEGHLNRIIDKGIKYLQQQRDRRNGSAPMTVEAIAQLNELQSQRKT